MLVLMTPARIRKIIVMEMEKSSLKLLTCLLALKAKSSMVRIKSLSILSALLLKKE